MYVIPLRNSIVSKSVGLLCVVVELDRFSEADNGADLVARTYQQIGEIKIDRCFALLGVARTFTRLSHGILSLSPIRCPQQTISSCCDTPASSPTLPSHCHLSPRWPQPVSVSLLMSAGVISWASHLANVTRHPHGIIGLCPDSSPEGTQLVRWIEIVSGQCVYGTLGAVSWSFGIPVLCNGSDSRLSIHLILAMCAVAANHHQLSKPLCRWTRSCLSVQLVHGYIVSLTG